MKAIIRENSSIPCLFIIKLRLAQTNKTRKRYVELGNFCFLKKQKVYQKKKKKKKLIYCVNELPKVCEEWFWPKYVVNSLVLCHNIVSFKQYLFILLMYQSFYYGMRSVSYGSA